MEKPHPPYKEIQPWGKGGKNGREGKRERGNWATMILSEIPRSKKKLVDDFWQFISHSTILIVSMFALIAAWWCGNDGFSPKVIVNICIFYYLFLNPEKKGNDCLVSHLFSMTKAACQDLGRVSKKSQNCTKIEVGVGNRIDRATMADERMSCRFSVNRTR